MPSAAIFTPDGSSVAEDYWSPKSMLTVKPKEAFGDAYICRTSNNKTAYMLSKFRMTQEAKEIHKEEVDAIQKFMSMQHDNLVRALDMKMTERTCLIALEYHVSHLGNFMSKICKTKIRKFLFQIISGVHQYHLEGLIHKDLRPPNILVYSDEEKLKVANFKLGFVSGSIKGNKEINGCYRAPEILYSYPSCMHTTVVDMWSVGCIFAEMLRGKPLFTGPSIIDRVQSIHSLLGQPDEGLIADATLRDFLEAFPKKTPKDLSLEFHDLEAKGVDLLSKLLRLDPEERITSGEALKHPYFSEA